MQLDVLPQGGVGRAHMTQITMGESKRIGALDSQKKAGKTIFGGGLPVSERAAATVWELSDREREIIRELDARQETE